MSLLKVYVQVYAALTGSSHNLFNVGTVTMAASFANFPSCNEEVSNGVVLLPVVPSAMSTDVPSV